MAEKSKRKHLLLGLVLFFSAAGIVYGSYWFLSGRFYASTDDAYVAGNLVPVMPEESGTVVSVLADETSLATAGEPLVKLDGADAEIAQSRAEADLAAAVRDAKKLIETENELAAEVKIREADLSKAAADFERRKNLIAEHAVSQEEWKHAEESLAAARYALSSAQHRLLAVKALSGNKKIPSFPAVAREMAKVRDAYLAVDRLSIRSPVTGYVARRTVEIGQRVAPGNQLMLVVPLDQIWVDANFKEDQLENIRIGQSVALTSDLYGKGVTFHGKIAGIGAGTGSVFSLLPPQNATGNWIKIVQRVPVRISLDTGEIRQHPLRIGLSLTAKVDTHDRNGKMLAEGAAVEYRTSVFDHAAAAANKRIEKILRDNE